MPKWWKIGFVSVLLITTSGLSAHVAVKDPALTGAHEAEVAEYKDEYNLDWEWSSSDLECQLYTNCVYLDVLGTDSCERQIKVFMYLTDKNEDWVSSADTVLESPGITGVALVEVGVNREDFEYFMVGDVRCTTEVPTVEASL